MPQEAFQEASRLSSSGSEDASQTTSASSGTESKSSSAKGTSVPRTKKKSSTKTDLTLPFISKERESHQFTILGIRPTRRGDNRLQFNVPADLVDRFMKHHHVESGRIYLEK
jgi:hypothetical protein